MKERSNIELPSDSFSTTNQLSTTQETDSSSHTPPPGSMDNIINPYTATMMIDDMLKGDYQEELSSILDQNLPTYNDMLATNLPIFTTVVDEHTQYHTELLSKDPPLPRMPINDPDLPISELSNHSEEDLLLLDDSSLEGLNNLLTHIANLYESRKFVAAISLLDRAIIKINTLYPNEKTDADAIKKILVNLLETRARRLEAEGNFIDCYSDWVCICTLSPTTTHQKKKFLIEGQMHEKERLSDERKEHDEAALEAYKKAGELSQVRDTDLGNIYYHFARLYASMGQVDIAIMAYEITNNLYYPLAETFFVQKENLVKAEQLFLNKQYEEAAIFYSAVIQSIQESQDFLPCLEYCYFQIGIIFYYTFNFKEGSAYFKKASQNPHISLKIEKALLSFNKLLFELKETAKKLLHEGKHVEAFTHYEKIVKFLPVNTGDFSIFAESHFDIGIIKLNQQQYEEALFHFKKAYILNYKIEYIVALIKDTLYLFENNNPTLDIKEYLFTATTQVLLSLKDIPHIPTTVINSCNYLDQILLNIINEIPMNFPLTLYSPLTPPPEDYTFPLRSPT